MSRSKQSLLWELRFRDSVRVSYLYGTMHVRDNKAFTHIEKAVDKLEQCNLLACEYNLEEARGSGLDQAFMIPDNQSLEDHVGSKKFKKWEKICSKSFGLELSQFKYLLPLTIISLISERVLQKENSVSLDQYLWEKGIEKDLQLAGVESFSEQRNIMTQLDLKYQLKMLDDLFKNVKNFRKRILKLVDMYMSEDIHKLYKLSKKSLGKYKALLLYDRNEKMADSIVQLTSSHNAFIAIGAAHLSGKKGVLHLLKDKNFIVTPCF